ncbi:MAG: ABC transporter substrate-binding protein [Pararhizobium sp.]
MKPILCAIAVSAAVLMTNATLPAAYAATPANTLVEAWAIDDIISLDPAEIFEFSTSEIAGNTYQRLIGYDLNDVSKIYGEVAESWKVSADGKTIDFKIKKGLKFASGNPLTAADVVFSLQRAVILDKSPAFIIGQFGMTKDNVKDKIKQTGDYSFTFTTDKPYATSFVLYCLTATVASVVDKKLVMEHEDNGDLGYGWLKTHYAGSGPFTIRQWKANEAVVLERNDNYSGPKPAMERVIYRHIPEPATERLLLEKGDIDVARKLGPEEFKALASNKNIKLVEGVKGTVYYLGLNQKNKYLKIPEVREAIKYLVDYDTIAATIMKGIAVKHETFLPKGFLGAIDDNPYSLNVEKAKALLAKAGLADGFSVTMDVTSTADITGMAQAIQQTFAKAGIKLEIIPGDDKQTLTKYRARNHDIYIGRWGSDYQDPNSNAQTFATNPDNSDKGTVKTLAWRNAWDPGDEQKVVEAAIQERDPEKRAKMYEDLQRDSLKRSPFVIMFQQNEVDAVRSNVNGLVVGPSFDTNSVAGVTKSH